jgi:hypothetical protein
MKNFEKNSDCLQYFLMDKFQIVFLLELNFKNLLRVSNYKKNILKFQLIVNKIKHENSILQILIQF